LLGLVQQPYQRVNEPRQLTERGARDPVPRRETADPSVIVARPRVVIVTCVEILDNLVLQLAPSVSKRKRHDVL
jgi:hypothetical protein